MAHFIYNDINSKSLGIIVNVLPERTIPAETKKPPKGRIRSE